MNYSEIFEKAWRGMKDNLALAAGLTFVFLVGLWVVSLIPFFGLIVSSPMTFGYIRCLDRLRRGEVFEFADFFWGFTSLNRLIQISILGAIHLLGSLVGFCLLILPGVWWGIATSWASSYFVLKNQDGMESIRASLQITKGRWWSMFGLMLLIGILNLAGVLMLGLGILITMPLTFLVFLTVVDSYADRPPPAVVVEAAPQ